MSGPGRSVAVLAALVAASLLVLSPARAEGELALSSDGVTWTGSLRTPLFDAAERWVPGDERTASFWVANRAAGRAEVSIVATDGNACDPFPAADWRLGPVMRADLAFVAPARAGAEA